MKRMVGTTVRGLRAPIFHEGDDLVKILPDLLADAAEAENFALRDHDVLCITESVLARCQGNYAHINDIAADLRKKFGENLKLGLVHPILSRNRFSVLLKGIARAADEVTILLSYPADEVGNHLIDPLDLINSGVNPYADTLDEEQFKATFKEYRHPFTGVNYIDLYREICEAENCKCDFLFANDPTAILDKREEVLCCDIHTRDYSKKRIAEAGAEQVLGLQDILNDPTGDHGYTPKYGLLGSNKATDDKVKLFPRDAQEFVDKLHDVLVDRFGKQIEVMVYGDGAFKDPYGKIWELADPVVSPAYTPGLEGRPNEVKIKYLADNEYADLSSEEQAKEIQARIREKHSDASEISNEAKEGTTPRRLTDLLGSLADLSSGSGDKGTPFVYIQGYFDTYAD